MICKLPHSIIKISSLENNQQIIAKFLQGLITNDLNLLNKQELIYTCMLNSKGRYNFDFFVYKKENDYYIDVHNMYVNSLINKLSFYRLFYKISFILLEDLNVYYVDNESYNQNDKDYLFVQDPRLKDLGYRYITYNNIQDTMEYDNYLDICYMHAVMDTKDFIVDKTIPIEVGMDELNALCYDKGCYLGQEFTNSSKRKLVIRKRAISVCVNTINMNIKDTILTDNQEKVGEVLAFSKKYAIAYINMKYKDNHLYVNGHLLKKNIPNWIVEYSTN